MRHRELWLWLGAAFLTIGGVFAGMALAYLAIKPNFAIYTSWQMLLAALAFVLAFTCFAAAVLGWPFPARRPYFPDVKVAIDGAGVFNVERPLMPSGGHPDFKVPTRISTFRVNFTNNEVERIVSIKAARLYIKVAPNDEWPFSEMMFTAPDWEVPKILDLNFIRFPVNLEPQTSHGGDLIFEISGTWNGRLADPAESRLEIEDAATNNLVTFPAAIGTFRKGQGMRPTTTSEWVQSSSDL